MARSFSFAAVGDISFAGPFADEPRGEIFEAVRPQWHGFPLVMGNLECPLLIGGKGVSGKCTMKGSTEWASILNDAGITVLSLANNHIMDFGAEGLLSTMNALERAGLKHVGAGKNRDDAQAPLNLHISGLDVAILARSSVPVSSPCYAGKRTCGAAYLDESETISSIQTCSDIADVVIVLVHWGVEEHCYPSPKQRQLATRMVSAGADIILGHHPHVVQGVQKFQMSAVAYSLGNFVFGEFEWTYLNGKGKPVRAFEKLKPLNRASIIFTGVISEKKLKDIQLTPTRIKADGSLALNRSRGAEKRNQLLSWILQLSMYRFIWHVYAMWMEWKLRIRPAIFGGNFFHKLLKLRWRHIRKGYDLFRRSSKVARGKSTNPYE